MAIKWTPNDTISKEFSESSGKIHASLMLKLVLSCGGTHLGLSGGLCSES